MPERIQRNRTRGWRMPEGAIYVGRPTLWGNPWTVADAASWGVAPDDRAAWVVAKYRQELGHWGLLSDHSGRVSPARWQELNRDINERGAESMADYAVVLAGRDLACWCPLEDEQGNRVPCHADVLLEIANAKDAADA